MIAKCLLLHFPILQFTSPKYAASSFLQIIYNRWYGSHSLSSEALAQTIHVLFLIKHRSVKFVVYTFAYAKWTPMSNLNNSVCCTEYWSYNTPFNSILEGQKQAATRNSRILFRICLRIHLKLQLKFKILFLRSLSEYIHTCGCYSWL